MNQINKNKDHKLVVLVVVFIFLVGIFIGLNFSNINLENQNNFLQLDDSQKSVDNVNENQFDVKNSIIENIYVPFTPSKNHDEIVKFALDKINQDRLEHNLQPVQLGTNTAAQIHASDMFELKYFSHWNSAGVKPYVTYSQNGGRNYLQENIAVSWCEGLICNLDPFKQVEKLEYSMVYDDASSDWGHRDAILNPLATHVNIGVSFDSHNFYFVQHFETQLVHWEEFSLSPNGILRMSGILPNGYELESITIYEDPAHKPVSAVELETKKPYTENSYDQGTLAGILVDKPPLLSFYQECAPGKISLTSGAKNQCILYKTFEHESNQNNVKIFSDVSDWLKNDSIKTIYVNLKNDKNEVISVTSVTLNFL